MNVIDITPLKQADQSEIKKLIADCLSEFKINNVIIEIIFVSENEIKKLNAEYRKINKATDVLSFPQNQSSAQKNILGSIVICTEVVEDKEETQEEVLKHGLLHLLGYDHERDEKEWETAAKKINCEL